jgi:putative addiction module component (TIGR02574 family)
MFCRKLAVHATKRYTAVMSTILDIRHLSPSECILLAEELWEHARTHPEAVPITEAQRRELERRVAALDSGEMAPGEAWEVVRERLFRR